MKKATLMIEVPDDWEKGNPYTCPYSKRVQHAWGEKDTYDCDVELMSIRKVHDCNKVNCPLEIQEKTKFTVNGEMFGKYCKIPTGFSKDMHIYKIVNMIESNVWVEVPITFKSEAIRHEVMEKVLSVIHCGLDETKVIRVALKDIEIQENSDDN